MTKYYTEGIWHGKSLFDGTVYNLCILGITEPTEIGDDIRGPAFDPWSTLFPKIRENHGGLSTDTLVGPSVLCKWSD